MPGAVDLDRLLRREMAIEPSPEFLARVRGRIQAGAAPARAKWTLFFPIGAGAATAALVMALNVAARDQVTAPRIPQPPRLATVQPIGGIAALPLERDARARRIPERPRVDERRPVVRIAVPDPPVMIDERQRAALAALVRIIRDGKLTDQSFAQTTPMSLDAIGEQIAPVRVSPVTVSPIAVDGVLQKEK
jgi:hypothetical protein